MSLPEPLDVDPEEVQDPFSRFAAIAIVVATLAGALVGYLEAQSSRSGALANVRAQRSMVRAMTGLVRTDRAAQVDFSVFASADRQSHEAANTLQRSLFTDDPAEELALELAQERFDSLAESSLELTELQPGGPGSPERDPTFPLRFFADSQREADRLWALADAANEEDAAWEGREANATAVLTMFAVAVYLLGLSLTIKERVRLLLAGVGIGLVLVGGVWGLWLATHPPERAPDEAAASFADARKEMLLATDREGFERAVRHFTRAVELRPTFAQAYADRSQASFRAGSPQIATFTSVSTPEALRDSTADLRRAQDLGLDNRSVLGDLGFHTFLLGLQTGDRGALEESLAYTDLALERDPSDPVLHYNRGVALLALGEAEAARAAYEEAARRTIYVDAEGARLRRNPVLEGEWVAGALTDLELLLAARPQLSEEVLAMKELTVGSASLQVVGVGEPTVEGASVELDLFSSKVQWRSALPGYDPERDTVSAQWYRRTSEGWITLPEVSGSVVPGGEAGAWFSLSSRLPSTFPPRCLEDGTYRAELFVNGHLAGVGEADYDRGELEPTVVADVNVGLCRPPGWEPPEGSIPGLIEGAVAPDGSEGVYLFRLQRPRLGREDASEVSGSFLTAMIDSFGSVFPAQPEFDSPAGEDFFLALDGPVKRWYRYESGYVLAGAGVAADGAVIIGAVFGPDEGFEDELLRVFDSLVELRPI